MAYYVCGACGIGYTEKPESYPDCPHDDCDGTVSRID